MTKMKLLFAFLALTAVAYAAGPAVHVVGAGSSGMWQAMGTATVNDLAPLSATFTGGGSIHHWTFKSACPGACEGILHDSRTNPGIGPIPNETATVWVVWTCPAGGCTGANAGDVWTDFQVDSVVGIRTILSRPNGGTGSAVSLQIDSAVKTTVNGANVISPTVLKFGVATGNPGCGAGQTTCDDAFIPADVYTALNGAQLNTGFTDIRPEDGKYATKRLNGPTSNGSGLGYGTIGSQLLGEAILSSYSATEATPVEFGLPGSNDPISLTPVPATLTVFPVGENPIVFITNRSNKTGLGAINAGTGAPYYQDLADGNGGNPNPLSNLFSGNDCAGDNAAFGSFFATSGLANFPITTIAREMLSGTGNTAEFTEFRTHGVYNVNPWTYNGTGAQGGSQEYNINPSLAGNNPLSLGCNPAADSTTGTRKRAVGGGEMVKEVGLTKDSIGYTFFSFGNVSSIATSLNAGYLTVDGVDPIYNSYAGGDPGQPATAGGVGTEGELPGACLPPACSQATHWTGGNSFPHLRDGTYRSWSLLRMICDTALASCSTDPLGSVALIAQAQADINAGTGVPDFVPFQNISFVRSHFYFKQFSGTEHSVPFVHFVDTPTSTLDIPGTAAEQGGDVGGCIVPVATNNTVVNITAATQVAGSTKYTYTVASGNPLALGETISVYGFAAAGDNGIFTITGLPAGQFKVTNAAGSTASATAFGSEGTLNCFQ